MSAVLCRGFVRCACWSEQKFRFRRRPLKRAQRGLRHASQEEGRSGREAQLDAGEHIPPPSS